MSREELFVVVRVQARQIEELRAANDALAAKLARLEHLLSRNSGNSSSPPSRDDDPGKPAAPQKPRRGGSVRARGKQPGAPGSRLASTDAPDRRRDRFPRGRCGCGAGLVDALDLGVVDRYQAGMGPEWTTEWNRRRQPSRNTQAMTYDDGLYGSAANSRVLVVSTLEQVMSSVNADGNPVGLLIVASHGHPDSRLLLHCRLYGTP